MNAVSTDDLLDVLDVVEYLRENRRIRNPMRYLAQAIVNGDWLELLEQARASDHGYREMLALLEEAAAGVGAH